MKLKGRLPFFLLLALLGTGCGRVVFEDSAQWPPIVPDCAGVTIPEGMAALSFEMADGRPFRVECRREGDTLFYSVRAWDRKSRRGIRYAPFPVYVSRDPIDPYIAYRLIEPSYEGWKEMGLYARELASYRERPIVTNAETGGGCVNCHQFPSGDPSRMMFHARGAGGGTVFLDGDGARLLNLAATGPRKQGVYPAWHPSGRYIAFSSNDTHQCFPIYGRQQVEVYDEASDLILLDLQTDSVSVWEPVCEASRMETFPAWSPDGDTLYFCVADSLSGVAENRASLRYRLEGIAFRDGRFSGEPFPVWACDSLSVSFPRIHGKWMLFTGSAYATFPIWHPEADLYLMDLETGRVQPAEPLNSGETDSYHSWSSNGRWVLFSSRRLDGRYTRLFIAHFDGDGHFGKPFLLPQKSYAHNVLRLKSYNVPEFVQGDPGRHGKTVNGLFAR